MVKLVAKYETKEQSDLVEKAAQKQNKNVRDFIAQASLEKAKSVLGIEDEEPETPKADDPEGD